MHKKIAKPFVKWAGGKSNLIDFIEAKLPYKRDDSFSYIEPFVGSGAVLFHMLNHYPNLKNVVINDINLDLINTYHSIVSSVDEIIETLKLWESEYHQIAADENNKKNYYYDKRDLFNDNEQVRLKEFCDLLSSKNLSWILSNSDVKDTEMNDDFFDDLYKNYTIDRVSASRNINSVAKKRGKISELLISNN